MRAKASIGAIGSCRVKTPLRNRAAAAGISFMEAGNYGYTHTSREALQQLRFLQGDLTFPQDVFRLIGGPNLPSNFSTRTYPIADFYVIEISSAKNIVCRGFALQFNYFKRHFADFFADPVAARQFRRQVPTDSRPARMEALCSFPQFRQLSPVDKELLLDTFTTEVTREMLEEDITALIDRIGRDRLMIVTHVNARNEEGALLKERDRLIKNVMSAAERCRVRCLDPTTAMERFGQARALCDQGRDLNHYTPEFEYSLFDDIRAACMWPAEGTQASRVA
jgi:hypothetical protein